jgi:hypothetical protein
MWGDDAGRGLTLALKWQERSGKHREGGEGRERTEYVAAKAVGEQWDQPDEAYDAGRQGSV